VPKQGPATTEGPRLEVEWRLQWGLIPLAPWLIVPILLLLKPNRRPRTCAACLAIAAAAILITTYFNMQVLVYLMFGLTVFWLLRHRLPQPAKSLDNKTVAFLTLCGLLFATCDTAFDFSGPSIKQSSSGFLFYIIFSIAAVNIASRRGWFHPPEQKPIPPGNTTST
jgi:hypothetical protein